jgi:ATP-binding cassette subfamily F protein 3
VEGHQPVTGYQSQEFAETLPLEQQVFRVVKDAAPAGATDQGIRSLLGSFGFQGDHVHKTVKVLSGGEKIRLGFARIFVNPPNLLLLDEPTTHLDLQGREALETAIRNYQGTVCLVSHDISFVRNTANGILSIGKEGVRRWLGGYDDFLDQSQGRVASGGKAPESKSSSASKPDGKRRKEVQKELRRIQNRLSKLETKIEELETEQAEELAKLNRGEVSDFAAHQQNLSRLAGEIQNTTREWIELGEQSEELELEL